MRLLAEHISKRPFFQLERRVAGSTPLRGTSPATLGGTPIPAYLFSAAADSLILAATNLGRAAAAPVAQLSFQPYDLLRVRPRDVARGRPDERLAAAGATLPAGARDVPRSIAGQAARGDPPKWRADLGHDMLALGSDGRWLWLEPEKLVQEGSSAGKGLSLRRNFTPVAFLTPAQISGQEGVTQSPAGGAHDEAGDLPESSAPFAARWIAVSNQGRLLNLRNLMPDGASLQPPETPAALELHAGESLLTCLEIKL
jgi:hypothetical protein